MKKILSFIVASMFLSGCSSRIITPEMYGHEPQDPDALVKVWLEDNLKDPDSAKVTKYSHPKQSSNTALFNSFYGYAACYGVNSKNGFGGYVGKKLIIFTFKDDNLIGYRSQNDKDIFSYSEINNLCERLKKEETVNTGI